MAITFGSSAAPSQVITNLDSLFSLSLANYRKTLVDGIGATNALIHALIEGDSYESADGGTYIAENLMYALTPARSYSGNDELSTSTTDGLTQAIYEWCQIAAPISYSMKEVFQNQHKLYDLVKAKIQQAEMGLQEGFAQQLFWGNYPQGGALTSPSTDSVNGSNGLNPLPLIVSYNTSNLTVGNLAESTNTWWRNRSATSAASTYSAFILEMVHMYNLCSAGSGGPITHIILDQVTYELFCHAYFSVYKTAPGVVDNTYPFQAVKFMKAIVVMDDKVPDVYTGTAGSIVGGVVDPATMTYGSAYFVNSKFFKLRYHPERNFDMLKNEEGKTFAKPINGDSRVGHVAWMGNLTVANRRKHGVIGKIARTLS